MKFIKEYKGNRIEFEIHEDSSLDNVLEHFENFLRACGYTIDYNLLIDLVDMDK